MSEQLYYEWYYPTSTVATSADCGSENIYYLVGDNRKKVDLRPIANAKL